MDAIRRGCSSDPRNGLILLSPQTMSFLTQILARLRALFGYGTRQSELNEEMESHLELRIEELREDGLDAKSARYQALREFGSVELAKEECRDSWGTQILIDTLRNLRFGLRLTTRYPSSSILAIIVLSLGVACATMMFTITTHLMKETSGASLSQRDVHIEWAIGPEKQQALTSRDFSHLQKEVQSMEFLVGIKPTAFWMHKQGSPETGKQYRGILATSNLLDLVRVSPAYGRGFTPQDMLAASERVILISDTIWSDLYDRNLTALGSTAVVDGKDYHIIGIMPAGFAFPHEQHLWVPKDWGDAATSLAGKSTALTVVGRLYPGVDHSQAQAELEVIAANLATAFPETNEELLHPRITSYADRFIDDDASLFLFFGLLVSIFVLLFACANSFQIIMARTARRSHELAVRCSLGAKRSHVITQVIIDGVTLSGIGTALGLLIATWGLHGITESLKVFGLPGLHTFKIQPIVIVFAASAGLFAGILSSFIPAWRASKIDTYSVLKDGSNSSSSVFIGKLSKAMVIAQVAFSVELIYLSLIMLTPTTILNSLDMPFDSSTVLAAHTRLGTDPKIDTVEKIDQFYQTLHQELTHVPGVRHMALSSSKLGLFGGIDRVEVEDQTASRSITANQSQVSSVSPAYLDVFKLEPLSGRMFSAFDTKDSTPVCVVNTYFAETYFPQENPIGKRVRVIQKNKEGIWSTIVGVVPTAKPKFPEIIEKDMGSVLGEVMFPLAQVPAWNLTILLSAPQAASYTYRRSIRESVQRISPLVRIQGDTMTIEQRLEMITKVSGSLVKGGFTFGIATLLISIIGLYSIISFTTSQRSKEFGIRIAVGASSWSIAKTVMKPWVTKVTKGLCLGAVGLFILGSFFTVLGESAFGDRGAQSSLLDFAIEFAGVTLVVCIAGLIAAGIPAWRATRINPIDVIRADQ